MHPRYTIHDYISPLQLFQQVLKNPRTRCYETQERRTRVKRTTTNQNLEGNMPLEFRVILDAHIIRVRRTLVGVDGQLENFHSLTTIISSDEL
jgi:hypothetical protein